MPKKAVHDASTRWPGGAYISAASFWWPDYLEQSAWIEHAPFAFWLMESHRPRTLVELGTHGGYSYFAFCQAVRTLGLDTRCYAVDHWKGDIHAGFYGKEIYQRVHEYSERCYGAFSSIVRSTFDEALVHFPDASIDLLHLDGQHFYEDVKHDFESWRPKLSDRAIVLFHDTNVREGRFGVFKVWEELQGTSSSFEFLHGHGLGVLGYGANLPHGIAAFLTATTDPSVATQVRQVYSRLGAALQANWVVKNQVAHSAELKAGLEEREREVKDLAAKLESEEGRVKGLAAELQAQKAGTSKFKAEVQTLNAQVETLKAQVETLKAQVETLKAQRETLKAQVETLKAQERGLKNSTSWRLTGPLRFISLHAKWLFRNLR
jgi:archaellum component FlaC